MQKTFLARRWLAVLLALTMVVSMIPAVLAADPTVTINPGSIELEVGGTQTFTASLSDSLTATKVTWSSDKPNIATVNPDSGAVEAKAVGTATITAQCTYDDNTGSTSTSEKTVSGTCTVTVKAASDPPPSADPVLTLNTNTLTLTSKGQTANLTAKVENHNGGTFSWESSPSGVVSFSGSQNSVTLTAGAVSSDTEVTVTVTYTYQGGTPLTATCAVTVKANTSSGNIMTGITGQELPKKPDEGEAVNLTLKTGASDTLTFALTAQMENGSTSPVSSSDGSATYTWSSDNQRLLTVQPNRGTNTATVTASTNDIGTGVIRVHATYTWGGRTVETDGAFTVKVERRAGTIRITPAGPYEMEPNDQKLITATTEPSGQMITWESGDEAIASMQTSGLGTNGILYANAPGETSLTASIGEGASKESQRISVTVSGIILEYDSVSLAENEKKMIPLVTRYGKANNGRAISWQSMDNTIAEVSGSSVVGRGPGKTTITGYCGAYTASFTVEVSAGVTTIDLTGSTPLKTGDTLKFSSLASSIAAQVGGSLSHLTSLSVPTSQGTLFYQYISEAQPGAGVAQSESYYAQGGFGRKTLADVTFVPRAGYSGPVTISYSAVASTGEIVSCRILHNVEQGTTSVFTMSTPYNTPIHFNSTEFNRVCNERTGAQLDSVSFSLPPVRQGALYTNYVNASNYGSAVSTRDIFTRKQLENVYFVPAPGYEGEVTIYYTGKSTGTNGISYAGQVRITVGRDTSVSIGGLSYDVVKNGVARFDDADFGRYCKDVLDDTQTLSFIRFDSLPSASDGVLYYDYRSSANTGSRAAAGTTYYYGTRTPRIDRLVFVPAQDFTGTIRIPFTGQTTGGTRFTGNVEVNVKGSSAGSGNIYYTCQPGKSVKLRGSDFNRLCREQVNDRLRYIQFQGLPSSVDGTLNYSSSAAAIDRSYYYGTTYPRIDNLSFRANSRFSGSVDIPFIGTADSGETFYGVITIDSNTAGSSDNDIHYYATSKTAAVFDRDDFDDLAQWLTDRDVSSVTFTVPSSSQGSLYQNYRSSSSQGTRITSSTATIAAGSLDRVAFVPASGFIGTVNVDFTAKVTNSEEFSGTVEITVEQAPADVTVRYSTRVSPVSFQGSDFAKSGSTLRSIRFSAMPPAGTGRLYYQYHSPTRYDRQASTGSSYNLTGSSQISDLAFVPRAGYAGTVTLPYVGTNSNGTTFEGEVIITVSPSSSSYYFNDMGGYGSGERAAVDYLYENGVTTGVAAGSFGPSSSITRGDFSLMVCKAFDLSASGSAGSFTDVPSWAYYAQAVNTLHALGIVSGVGNGRFSPDSNVTREDALIMVRQAMRAVGWSAADGFDSALNGYSDAGSVSQYARGAVSFALQMGYLPTSGGRIDPREHLSRVDMAQILHRVLTF